jgi:hypothetical protein
MGALARWLGEASLRLREWQELISPAKGLTLRKEDEAAYRRQCRPKLVARLAQRMEKDGEGVVG